MEGSLLDEEMKIIRSDPQLLTRRGEVLMNEMNAMENEQANQQESIAEDEEEEEETIEIDKKYNSMREIRLAAIEYGRRRKFAVSTLRSGARQLVLACKHSGTYRGTKKTVTEEPNTTEPGNCLPAIALQQVEEEESTPQKRTRKKVSRKIECPFQIRAKPIKGDQWIVYKMVLEHNHPMAVDSKAYAQHRKLDEETQKLIVRLMRSGSTNTMIVKYLSLKGIRNVVRKDIANLRQTYFNPNNNKINGTGNILYQVEQIDDQEPYQAEQIDSQQVEQINMQENKSYQAEQINMQENESSESVAIQAQKVVEAMKALKREENQ
ncbi:hypothetical protein BDF21DRAFT_411870 [Thamnidium elegans]|uniref:FAR1 domain-containing protein n=1 Tax=Thamnidium elegans TaxID=101142 RepID=A0A8H7SKH3_9FUNG|nr:hypothetical protein INT48_005474 [Thamnidium elegans]KAI8090706.1 hypothetical protein BDF21DRAFT_411870 [Thamnidium elegans]